MCRSKAQGGRRCPSKQGGGGSPTFGNIMNASSAVLDSPPITDSSVEQLNPLTPTYNTLLTTSAEEWWAMPWKDRKQVMEVATDELLKLTGSTATFGRWNKTTQSDGRAGVHMNRLTGEIVREIEYSDITNRNNEPLSIADVIAHEVAHTISGVYAAHGQEWSDNFKRVKAQVGLKNKHVSEHVETPAERDQRIKALKEREANAPWQGQCPQGHDFTAGRKPKYRHSCVRCKGEGKPALITYERRSKERRS